MLEDGDGVCVTSDAGVTGGGGSKAAGEWVSGWKIQIKTSANSNQKLSTNCTVCALYALSFNCRIIYTHRCPPDTTLLRKYAVSPLRKFCLSAAVGARGGNGGSDGMQRGLTGSHTVTIQSDYTHSYFRKTIRLVHKRSYPHTPISHSSSSLLVLSQVLERKWCREDLVLRCIV